MFLEKMKQRFVTETKIKEPITKVNIAISIIASVTVAIFVITLLISAPTLITNIIRTPSVIAIDSSNSVTLTWTAPGDDANIGTATAYDIRYSIAEITNDNWAQATQIEGESAPGSSGTSESLQVIDLIPNTTYYFALKTVDEAGNWSGISNIASKTTDCFEAWSCTEWSDCLAGSQTRECIDLNSCGTQEEMPETSQSCQQDPENLDCDENWECTEWSFCANGQQTRTCTDLEECGTEVYKPGETRECQEVGGSEEEPEIIIRETLIITGVNEGGGPQIKVFDQDGNLRSQFWAFEESFKGGVNVAATDLGVDNVSEIIVGAGPGYLPMVRIFDSNGYLIDSFLAYDVNFRGGIKVAAGDLDGDGLAEIVTTPQSNGGPNVRIFGYRQEGWQPVIENFFAYNVGFRGGVSVAVCDLDRGKDEIITIPNSNGGPHLRVFGYRDGLYRAVILGLFTHHQDFRGGVNLGCGDLEGNGYDQIIAAPSSNGGPHVRTFGRNRIGSISILSPGFMAFHPDFRGGVSLAAGDFNYDYQEEIVAAVASQDRALIRIFYKDGTLMKEFTAYPDNLLFGVNVATGKF